MSKLENIAPKGMRRSYRLRALLNPMNWFREYQWQYQRSVRGFSNRDTWGGGEYVAQVLLNVIRHIQEYGHSDLEFTWKQVVHSREFKTLASAIEAVQAHLDLEEGKDPVHETMRVEWHNHFRGIENINEDRTEVEKDLFKKMIDREMEIYDKAKRAMALLGKNIFMFWD